MTTRRSWALFVRDPSPPGMQRFWILHAAYTSLEMLKLLTGILVAFWLSRDAAPSKSVSSVS